MGNAKDARISDLLKTEEDIENGFFLAQMFTSALVANVQGHLKEKLKAIYIIKPAPLIITQPS